MKPATTDTFIELACETNSGPPEVSTVDVSAIAGFQVTTAQPVPWPDGGPPANGLLSCWDFAAIREGWYKQPVKKTRVKRPFRERWPLGLHGLAMIVTDRDPSMRGAMERDRARHEAADVEWSPPTIPNGLFEIDYGGMVYIIFDAPERIAERVTLMRDHRVREIIITGQGQRNE